MINFNSPYLYYLLFVLLISISLNSVFCQSLDNPMFSYDEVFDSLDTSQELLNEFEYLEKNWYCIEDKEVFFEKISSRNLSVAHIEYLSLLKAYNLLLANNSTETEKILIQLQKKKVKVFSGRINFALARLNAYKKNTSKAIDYLDDAYDIFIAKGDYKSAIHSLNYSLSSYLSINDYESAAAVYSKSLLLCEKHDYLWGFLHLFRAYGKSVGQIDLNLSHEILLKGYKLAQSDTSWWSITLRVEYLRYLLRYKNDERFERLLDKSISLIEKKCIQSYYGILLTFKAHIFSNKNEIDSAIYYNERALIARKRSKNKNLATYSYLNLSKNYMQNNDLKRSKIYLDSVKYIILNHGNLKTKRNYLFHLINYYKLQNENDSLIIAYNQLIEINKEYFEEQQQVLSKKIELKNEINSKLSKEKYELLISKKNNRFIYVTIISVLSIIVIIFLIIRLRNKDILFQNLVIGSKVDKKALKKYQTEIEQLKEIFKNAPKGVLITDAKSTVKYFNMSAQKIFGNKIELFLGSSIYDYISERFQDTIKSTINRTFEKKENQEATIEIVDLYDKNIKVNISITPLIFNKEIESLLFIATDITESENALSKIKQERIVLQTLINSVTESIILIDKNYRIALINETAASRLGGTEEALMGKNYMEIIPLSLRKNRKIQIEKVFQTKLATVFEDDIDSYHTLVSYYPNINTNGEVEFIAEFSQDITEREIASEQINSLRQKVLRSQMNPHFIFNSLNAIQSYMLKKETVKAVNYLSSFAKLIRMILDSSRYDYITLSKEISILQHYLDLQQLRFGDKFTYKLDIDESLDIESLLIPVMLAQPFIENAIEHGLQHLDTKGTVRISFVREQENIVFNVIDNGIGRQASMKIQENIEHKNHSLSTQIFKERLFTLNKFSGKKITYNIIDLKDNAGNAKGTMVIINLPLMYN